MEGIAEMFAELNGYDVYFEDVYAAGFHRRARAVEITAEWRRNNPERSKKLLAAGNKRWRNKFPEKARALKRRYIEKNREHMREVWRRNTAAYRARKKAAK